MLGLPCFDVSAWFRISLSNDFTTVLARFILQCKQGISEVYK